jgi:5-methylcytosine-specific restriction protein A
MARAFRSPESLAEEAITRNLIISFLQECGFTRLRDQRRGGSTATQQIVFAQDPDSRSVGILVRCVWHEASKGPIAASQLVTSGSDNEVQAKVRHAKTREVTHYLFVERSGERITCGAFLPVDALYPAWRAQKEEADRLLSQGGGRVGQRRSNPALNGSSATLTLRDDNFPDSFTEKLWQFAVDLAQVTAHAPLPAPQVNDTFDDLGSDDPERTSEMRSGVIRDQRVRQAVRARAQGKCERCGTQRDYAGFLDVHHILGADKSDRPWTCVALCPNCHREAHFAPHADRMNAELLQFAGDPRS